MQNCSYVTAFINTTYCRILAFAYNCLFNKKQSLDTEKHKVIAISHPSPLSANKKFKEFPKFLGSKPFSKVNSLLMETNIKPIIWKFWLF